MLRLQLRRTLVLAVLSVAFLCLQSDGSWAVIAGAKCLAVADNSGGSIGASDVVASSRMHINGTCTRNGFSTSGYTPDASIALVIELNSNHTQTPVDLNTFRIAYHTVITNMALDGVAYTSGTQIVVATADNFSRVVTYTFGGNDLTFTVTKAAGTDTLGAFTIAAALPNTAPTITSSSSVNAAENQTAVTTVTATDPQGDKLTFSISGGSDASKFDIAATTGVLTFKAAPDFEAPGSKSSTNVYGIGVAVTDTGGLTDTQTITVTVTDVVETGPNVISFNGPADTDFSAGSVGLTATASSGLAVTFASTTPAVCTVSGAAVAFGSVGSCSITASQAGNANFVAAADVVQSFAIAGNKVATKTKAIVSNTVSRRAGRILSATPNLVSRLGRSGSGDFGNATGFNPLGFSGSGTLDNAKMAFSTSLRQVIGASNAGKEAQRRELGEMMALGEQSLLSQYNTGLQPGFDVWVKGSLDHATTDNRKSDLAMLFIGADYHLSDTMLVGVLTQFDWSDEKDTSNAFTTDGKGWMVGPYMATRLSKNLLFDGRASYGQSSNHISPLGSYEDSFDTTRWLVNGTLTGDFNMGSWRFSPHVGVTYFEETQKAYTDSISNTIAAQTISLGRMTFGPEVSTSYVAGNGMVVSPHIGIKGIWDFEKAQTIDLNTGLASGSDNDLRASIEAGLTTQFANGWRLAGEGHYDGIGDDSLEAYGGSLKLTVSFN